MTYLEVPFENFLALENLLSRVPQNWTGQVRELILRKILDFPKGLKCH